MQMDYSFPVSCCGSVSQSLAIQAVALGKNSWEEIDAIISSEILNACCGNIPANSMLQNQDRQQLIISCRTSYIKNSVKTTVFLLESVLGLSFRTPEMQCVTVCLFMIITSFFFFMFGECKWQNLMKQILAESLSIIVLITSRLQSETHSYSYYEVNYICFSYSDALCP